MNLARRVSRYTTATTPSPAFFGRLGCHGVKGKPVACGVPFQMSQAVIFARAHKGRFRAPTALPAWVPLVALILCADSLPGQASGGAFRAHGLFSDRMVLQHGVPVAVFGFGGTAGEKVEVRLAGHVAAGVIGQDGWSVTLPALAAGGPHELVIRGPSGIAFRDVLIGDVWLASGQSNMHMRLRFMPEYKAAPATFANPSVRLIRFAVRPAVEPERDIERAREFRDGWQAATPEAAGEISAVGWYFADRMQRATGVPIGLIHAAHGSTRTEAWMDKQTVLSIAPDERPFADLSDPKNPWVFYNGMIAPITCFPLAGFLWYQGESHGHRPFGYPDVLRGLIRSRRAAWGDDRLPFYLAQVHSFRFPMDRTGEAWAWVREGQREVAASEPHTGLVPTHDLGEYDDIHPLRKKDVGLRLADLALADRRGARHEGEGPSLSSIRGNGGRLVLSFSNTMGGLRAVEVVMNKHKGLPPTEDPEAFRVDAGTLTGFAVADASGRYLDAHAEIRGDRVVVWNDEVKEPVSVRYGWANFTLANLANGKGFLAAPFRTDTLPMPNDLRKPAYWERQRDRSAPADENGHDLDPQERRAASSR
jgi:sialate O-acetylesterase